MKLFTPEAKERRSQFLTVICILTMVYCAYSLFQSSASLIMGKPTEEKFEASQDQIREQFPLEDDMSEDELKMQKMMREEMLYFNEQSHEKHTELSALNLIVSITGLLGALLMINLDKRGFGLYITSCLLWVFGWLMFFETGLIVNTLMVFAGIISLAFIFMYGMNLKHMKLKYF